MTFQEQWGQLEKDYAPFKDMYGVVNPPGIASYNGMTYHASYLEAVEALFRKEFGDTWFRSTETWQSFRHKQIKILEYYELSAGVLKRIPGGNSMIHQGPDDYYGRFSMSRVLQDGFCKRFLWHGRTNFPTGPDLRESYPWKKRFSRIFFSVSKWMPFLRKFHYNQLNPGTVHPSTWLGRRQGLILCAQMVADEKFWVPLRPLWWSFQMIATGLGGTSKPGHWRLAFNMASCSRIHGGKKRWWAAIPVWIFQWGVERSWGPGGWGKVEESYFEKQGWHASNKWLWGFGINKK